VGFALNASNLPLDVSDVVTQTTGAERLVGIAAVGYIPQWIFYRRALESDGPWTGLNDLKGRRVAMGDPNSGTRAIGRYLLAISDIEEDELEIVDASPHEAMKMLESGAIDVMFLSSGGWSETVQELIASPDIVLMDLELAPTYSRVNPLFHDLVLLRGSFSFSELHPPEDKRMLAVASVLVSKESLSPDIQLLFVRGVRALNGEWGRDLLFPTDDVFPTVKGLTFSPSKVTTRFINEGETFLQRYLPFWIASPLERFYLLLLPLALLIYPVLRSIPSAYEYMIRRRFFPWYRRFRQIELHIDDYSVEELQAIIEELEDNVRDITNLVDVPTGYLDTVYDLRFHIGLVLDRVRERLEMLQSAACDPAKASSDRVVSSC
jgi:hypothetical protein